jgi:two-component system phosphate regulon sensor histidine kinase PhoR
MQKRIPDPLLMLISILVIIGFQVYWVRDNYFREKKALEIKTNSLFRETVRHAQDSVLKRKLSYVMKEDKPGILENTVAGIKLDDINDDEGRTAKVASLLGEKVVDDSLRKTGRNARDLLVTFRKKGNDSNKTGNRYELPGLQPDDIKEVYVVKATASANNNTGNVPDSLKIQPGNLSGVPLLIKSGKNRTRKINTLYFNNEDGKQIIIQVDSLFKDSLPPSQLSFEFAKVLKAGKLDVPFTISKQENDMMFRDDRDLRPDLPFGNFAGYSLKLGNTFPYLLSKITAPVLFSIFLIGVTVLSFVLLYRTLLKQNRLAVMKNEFISNITHELKTPIATVGVAIEALRNFGAAQSREKTTEYLDISAAELQRLGLLVDQVLKLSMFESRHTQLKKESFDLRELVSEVLNIMKLQFEKCGAVVEVKTEGDNFIIEADRLHMISVLYNLLDNAVKYSSTNPVIDIRLSELPRDIIELKISDNGIGIPKEYQSKIFDKFFRVPIGNQHNIKGYGLGLSYVSEIVKQHMGYIVVSGELGKGTAFAIKIPRREANEIYFDDKRKVSKKVIKLPGKAHNDNQDG